MCPETSPHAPPGAAARPSGPDRPPSWLGRLWLIPSRHPWLTLVFGALILGLALCSAARIHPVSSLRPMFAATDPTAAAMVTVYEQFEASDSLFLLVRDPAGTDQDPVATLTAFARRLKAAVATDRAARTMVTAIDYQAADAVQRFIRREVAPNGLYYLNDQEFDRLRQRLTPQGMRQAIARDEALVAAGSPVADALGDALVQDPLQLHELLLASMPGLGGRLAGSDPQGRFIGKDGRSLLIRIRAAQPAGNLDFTRRFMPMMRRVVRQAAPGPLKVEYTGGYPIAELSEHVIRRDMILNIFESVALLQIIFLVFYRRLWNFPLTFLPVAWGIGVAFGVFALFTRNLTPVVGASGGILAGMGVEYGIHYLSTYHRLRLKGLEAAPAADATIKLAPALFAACITSMIGFGVIATTRVPALRDFALIDALGLGGTLVGVILLMPAVLTLLNRRTHRDLTPIRIDLGPMVGWVGRHLKACLLVSVAGLGLCGLILAWRGPVNFEQDMSVMNPRPNPPLQAQADLARLFPGALESVLILEQAPSPPALITQAHEVENRLAAPSLRRFGVTAPLSIALLLPDPARVVERRRQAQALDVEAIVAGFDHAVADSAFAPTAFKGYAEFLKRFLRPGDPPGIKTLAQYPAISSMLLPRVAFAHPDRPVTQALTTVQFARDFASARQRQEAARAIRTQLTGIPGVTVTGMDLLRDAARDTVERDLMWLTMLSQVFVFGWILLSFRSVGLTLLSTIPPAFGFILLLAVMALLDVRWNLVNVVAIPILMGTGVDNGIFQLSLARQCRGSLARLMEEMATSNLAVLLTAATSVLGFGSLLFTHTPAIQSLGLVLAVGMTGCWLGSMFLLLPLIILLERRRGGPDRQIIAPIPQAAGQLE